MPGIFRSDQHQGAAAVDAAPFRTFLRQWMHDPVRTASVAPSGRQLAGLMVAQLPRNCGSVIEVGAGTGVFTQALLAAGVAPSRLLVVEINRNLAAFLRQRFPGIAIACADARNLEALAREHGMFDAGKPDAVVSGLGLLSMSRALRTAIVGAAFAALAPAGRLIQFTYGPFSPVRRNECAALGIRARRSGFALLNLPPASVYLYERRAVSAAVRSDAA